MSKYAQSLAAFSIMGAAILGAVAVLLVPALFEEFRIGRLTVIVFLLVGALGFGTVAKWSRNQDKE